MAYTYRGTIRDVEPEPSEPTPESRTFDPAACGTTAGYKRHLKTGVPMCRPCQEANAAYCREWRAKTAARPFNPDACGTYAGYHRHKHTGIPACDPCRAANADYTHHLRARRVAA